MQSTIIEVDAMGREQRAMHTSHGALTIQIGDQLENRHGTLYQVVGRRWKLGPDSELVLEIRAFPYDMTADRRPKAETSDE